MVYGWASPSIELTLSGDRPIRYVALDGSPDRVRSVVGSYRGRTLDRSKWRASNLFAPMGMVSPVQAWTLDFTLNEVVPGSTLAIAVNGVHGVEGAYAALRVGDGYAGASRRAPSFPSNTWEVSVATTDRNTTYFIELTEEMVGVPLQAVVLGLAHRTWAWGPVKQTEMELRPEAWVTAYPAPLSEVRVSLPRSHDAETSASA